MQRRRTLLQRYDIPLNHLDFAYISNCDNGREMEKIVHILRSGEEGYFPDLLLRAEEKLRQLKPNSRFLLQEEQIRRHNAWNEWQQLYAWEDNMRNIDRSLAGLRVDNENENDLAYQLPPVRQSGRLHYLRNGQWAVTTPVRSETMRSARRIRATDYTGWDSYDADAELLRMDLAEERVKEEVERKNRINLEKTAALTPLIIDKNRKEPIIKPEVVQKLSDVERNQLSEEARLRGNEYYRVEEFENAVQEYTRAIELSPENLLPAYNNRAIAYLRMKNYLPAIEDSKEALKLDPTNKKAKLRLAEASYGYGRTHEAYKIYMNVLEVDPENVIAKRAVKEISMDLKDVESYVPPENATRLLIEENTPCSSKEFKNLNNNYKNIENQVRKASATVVSGALLKTATENAQVLPDEVAKTVVPIQSTTSNKIEPPAEPIDYNLPDLVLPNKVVQNKFAVAAAALQKSRSNYTQPHKAEVASASSNGNLDMELRFPVNTPKAKSAKMIEEI